MDTAMKKVKKRSILASGAVLAAVVLLAGVEPAEAVIRGTCADCHTMHNSQDGGSMAYGTGPNAMLTRGSCIGCHAQNPAGGAKIVTIGGNSFPQVMHADASGDLAAGNFAYITGAKGSGANDNRGHNVIDVVSQDSRAGMYGPPGGIVQSGHNNGGVVNSSNLTCAGGNGCHGNRGGGLPSGVLGLKGAHHGNVDGLLTEATTPANSYRFLMGVRGLENPNTDDRWQNASSSSHNEYFGAATPGVYGCSNTSCHTGGHSGPVVTKNNTISGFCGTCHGNFHTLYSYNNSGARISTGIGTSTSSPFIRHPSDIVIKNSGEYAGYTTYNLSAPVGRQTLVATPSSTVTPGTDTITCLSCHMAHASNYAAMLRFDYSQMMAHNGGAASGSGCFACHTTKDE
jgi:hypothetical protein